MSDIDKQIDHFNSIADKYYRSRQTSNHLVFKDLLWTFFFKDKSYLRKNGQRVLEPMCGYAEGKKILEKHLSISILYEGFDYSDNLVKIVEEMYPGIKIQTQDVTTFIPAKEYDIIILIGGLHHVPDYSQEVLVKLQRGLSSKGFIINFEPTDNNHLIRLIRKLIYKRNALFDNDTERSFTLHELNDMYKNAGLKIIDQIYPGLLSYILYYNPDAFPILNVGGNKLVRFIFSIDKKFFRNFIGGKLSFATLSILSK